MSRVFFVIFMFLASCSSTVQIAGSNANFQGPDPAGGKKGLMYDKKSLGNLDIYANAGHKGKGNIEGGFTMFFNFLFLYVLRLPICHRCYTNSNVYR